MALRWGAVALTVLLFLLSLGAPERTAERLEIMDNNNEVHRRMLEAAARRPHGRDGLARRLRDGQF